MPPRSDVNTSDWPSGGHTPSASIPLDVRRRVPLPPAGAPLQPYAPAPAERLHAAARAASVDMQEGISLGLLGPTYETPAEVRMLRAWGGDAVGMSTVLETIAARWAGLEVAGVSLVTNPGAGYSGVPLSHEEVLAAGAEAGPRLAKVIRRFVRELPPT